ncbi:hypothetical protein N2599_23410 (plasmid) [Rhizobium sullae]|uniref:Uncharacterized protein n=1 Tax=Rhizobium sullae TaxID=50338 RepID=A0A2N0D9Q8_RHISU|nr:hypothetical protein [Rhizobium sullae]PKA42816.1 hypothetical protein CWR43_15510 [Rhizobium sullae]UWU18218.1 hypothetical protein N2599_23410 [Rhizobium sullae]
MDTIPTEGFDAAVTPTDHLDQSADKKRRELARVLQILFFEVELFRATRLSGKKVPGKVLRVILCRLRQCAAKAQEVTWVKATLPDWLNLDRCL